VSVPDDVAVNSISTQPTLVMTSVHNNTHNTQRQQRGVFQEIPKPNRAWLLGNRRLTPVASGRPLVYHVT